jgi:hypothetical protein
MNPPTHTEEILPSHFKESGLLEVENCTLLGYWAVSSGNFFLTFGTTYWSHLQSKMNTCCIITQKNVVLIYFAAETWNHALLEAVNMAGHEKLQYSILVYT